MYVSQKLCLLNDDDTNTDDLGEGCTGDLQAGQLIVKQWEDPFLHAQCAKRQRREKVGATSRVD